MRYAMLILLSFATSAAAEFAAEQPSINGTGQILPAGAFELGLQQLAYGLSADWQIRLPAFAALVGYGKGEVRRRWLLADHQRVSPYAALATPRHASIGADYGWDLGTAREHSLTVGARVQYGPLTSPFGGPKSIDKPARQPHGLCLPNFEYDYYGGGNDAYAGISDYLLYAGHTWAFGHIYVGVIVSPASGLIPLPYAYWRF